MPHPAPLSTASANWSANWRRALRTGLALLLISSAAGVILPRLHSQLPSGNASQPMPPIDFGNFREMPDHLARLQMVKRLNIARQKQMTDSSARLVHLAADLKAEVDHSKTTRPPADTLQKAEEIAKLAHNIRQKMVESYTLPEPTR